MTVRAIIGSRLGTATGEDSTDMLGRAGVDLAGQRVPPGVWHLTRPKPARDRSGELVNGSAELAGAIRSFEEAHGCRCAMAAAWP